MRPPEPEPIAVIGVYVRAPGGGDDLDAFWRTVVKGQDVVTTLSSASPDQAGSDPTAHGHRHYVSRRGVIADIGQFDAGAFGIPPREAELTDPQHRLMLEAAWVLLERAGHAAGGERTGVFVGAGLNHYLLRHILADPSIEDAEGLLPIVIANEKDHLAAKIAYRLGLTGPALTVQTACSTSLVAVHQAIRALRGGDADLVLAGGVSVELPQETGYAFVPGSVESRSGRCRPFQAGRDGTVPGNGLGLVALRRLEDALADNDTVLAVIRGSAVNNDGGAKAGYTAPGFAGQVTVLRMACLDAGIEPATVGYLEGHGTGTEVGDDIELAALGEVFARGRAQEPLSLGSAKANFGHLDAAAGVVGLIKTVLAVHHGIIPPLTGAGEGAAADDLPDGFLLDPVARPWVPAAGAPRRAGVSSFGIGGTNCHVVVEEYRSSPPAPAEDLPAAVIPLSAMSQEGALRYRDALVKHLTDTPAWRVGDVARTFTSGRRGFPVRLAAVLSPEGLARESLQDAPRQVPRKAPPVVLAFAGQGAPVHRMLDGLYSRYAVVRDHVEGILARLPSADGARIRSLLLEEAGGPGPLPTDVAQLALYITQVAVAELLASLGVESVAVLGHSVGEFAAACVAGEFSAAEGALLVRERGRLMAEAEPGAMTAVPLGEREALAWATGALEVAAVNGATSSVMAGPVAELVELETRLASEGVITRRLDVGHAFHTRAMDEAAKLFADFAGNVALQPPARLVASSCTGSMVDPQTGRDARYWAAQLRQPVRFLDAVRALAGAVPGALVVEIGPGRSLSGLLRPNVHPEGLVDVVPALPSAGVVPFLIQLGRLWSAGAGVDLAAANGAEAYRRVPLPTYPFSRRRYWINAPRRGPATRTEGSGGHPPLEEARPQGEPAAPAGQAAHAATLPAVLRAWQETLGFSDIEPDADLYMLGGDSFTLVRLAVRLSQSFPAEITATNLLGVDLTPRAMADLIDAMTKTTRAEAG